MKQTVDAKWAKGLNSLLESSLLGEGEYAWAQNVDNYGAIISTRQGVNSIGQNKTRLPNLEPKGIAVFKDKLGRTSIVIAIGSQLYACYSPFNSDFILIGNGFYSDDSVVFCKAFVSNILNADTTVTALDVPYPILVMQNGVEAPIYWDGQALTTSVPSMILPQIPVGKWMQWSGGRLWVASGNLLHASDFGNPLSFYEETTVAPIGPLFFEDTITGMNQTPSLTTLLVCTDFDTSTVETSIFDRTQWAITPGFQKVFLPGIGCASGKSFVRHWGIVWWYSHGGLVALDIAIQTYRTSRIRYHDQEMIRSKSNLADNISSICAGSFGNYMLVAVPSGDKYNAHIWVLSQRPIDLGVDPYYGDPSAWASNWTGIKPVDFITTVIDGRQRFFCLSREDGDAINPVYPAVWEMFTGERQDRFNDHTFSPPCMFETKLLGISPELKTFHYAELDIAELKGKANIKVYAAGRRGKYYQIMDKDLVASEGSINSNATAQYVTQLTTDFTTSDHNVRVVTTDGALPAPATINVNGQVVAYTSVTPTSFGVVAGQILNDIPSGAQVTQPQFSFPGNPTIIENFIPQRRMLRTARWEIKSGDGQLPVENLRAANVDRGFSLLVTWTGRLAITGLRIFYEPYSDQMHPQCEDDEEFAQFLDSEGDVSISQALETPTIDTSRTKSQYLRIITPRNNDILGYRPLPDNL